MTNYDYWANHSFFDVPHVSEKAVIDYLLKGSPNPYPQEIPDLSARVALATLALLGDKEYARTGTRREPGGLIQLYQQPLLHDHLRERLAQYHDLMSSAPDLTALPLGSFVISFTFRLINPYLSKDDVALHLLENPVKKEWIFKLPYVASTQWKGILQATMLRQLVDWWQNSDQAQQQQRTQRKQFVAWRIQLTRLFGTEIENVQQYLSRCGDKKLDRWYKRYVRRFVSKNGFLAGRLYFYPTFFDRLSLEVINPHNRTTGAGSQPIYFEAVPADTTGAFMLLYAPTDRVDEDSTVTCRQVASDLQLIVQGLEALFTRYGFGAKTSSGYGLAEQRVQDGVLRINYTAPRAVAPSLVEPAAPVELQQFLVMFPNEDFSLKPNDWRQQRGATNSQREAYKQAREAHLRYQQELASFQAASTQQQMTAQATPTPFTEASFDSFARLREVTQILAKRFADGGEA
jgi:CRISPR-associated protein Cmr2